MQLWTVHIAAMHNELAANTNIKTRWV